MITNFDLIIFDCDGVVVDSEPIVDRVFGEMLAGLGLHMSLEEMCQRFMGRSLRDCLEISEGLLGAKIPEKIVDEYRERRDAALRAEVKPIKGIRELIHALDIPYCIASSAAHDKIQVTLGATGLLPLFENRIFSATDVPNAKPAPDVFLFAAKQMMAEPSRTAVIEDTVNGVLAARAAQMVTFGYSACTDAERLMDAGADATFGHMSELLSLITNPYAAGRVKQTSS